MARCTRCTRTDRPTKEIKLGDDKTLILCKLCREAMIAGVPWPEKKEAPVYVRKARDEVKFEDQPIQKWPMPWLKKKDGNEQSG